MPAVENVAIIGGGLAGLSLALALHQQSISSIVYELRSEPRDLGGAITLSPNSLKILDLLGVYESVVSQGFRCNAFHFRTENDEPFDSYEIGSEEKYGYPGLRVYRKVLIKALLAKCTEKDIRIIFDKKFKRILSETAAGVTWEFDDGTVGTAASLVGADGIHSRVRSYLDSRAEPQFTGVVGVAATIPTDQVNIPQDYQMPVTIMNKAYGAYILAQNLPDGSEMIILKQKRSHALSRQGWEHLLTENEECVDFLKQDAEFFPDIVRMAVAKIDPDTIFLWPFHQVPEMKQWSSEQGRVSIIGDAAHAIPPSSGQGANQVFEDAYTFALICGRCDSSALAQVLPKWKEGRQERVNRLITLAEQMNVRRLPEGANMLSMEAIGSEDFHMDWLFKPNFEEMVQQWMES
ncbi:FAD-dependent oxidoreductase [Aspergillus aculeatinus CBS 121060]|uniref:FAD/NAD(P)-binding domain-containing protein n=1 Tax=Aspergillus aculeatinus CBS 121060 TaxID=1448322 RepID=A0ACD1H200_9EURO|nr:FAD/NAD(P)-binding domain-containing protein [Aspergillus aculeatinus CBS 121060]RAH67557.1 FAD/NAD(P)-binding domain-containing protein [Aspergillus aculeatinus CBS 121060]